MKVHISVDMEGIAGVTHESQTEQGNHDYPRARELQTNEVLAAIEGARKGGASEFVICDAHDTGRNLLIERFDDDVEIIQGGSYEFGMMAGISSDFDAAFQVGYHAMRNTHMGVIGHTYTYTVLELRINGTVVGESGLNAALAGHFGVPLTMVVGDKHAVDQAQKMVKGLIGVPVKTGVGIYGARSFAPKKACTMIRAGAETAIRTAKAIRPFAPKTPIRIEVRFASPVMAQYCVGVPTVQRLDDTTVAYKSKDMPAAFSLFEVLLMAAKAARGEGEL